MLLEVAREVTRSKPVILLKGGATEAGANAAVAHTAALASDDRLLDGALRQAGVVSDMFVMSEMVSNGHDPEKIRLAAAKHGADAVLVGTSLVAGAAEGSDPAAAVADLVAAFPAYPTG